jgi:hypothetical protein
LLPGAGGLDPAQGIDLTYFTDANGFSKKMIELAGPGFVWFDWLMNIKSEDGSQSLVAKYARVKPTLENFERGIAIYNDETETFEKQAEVKDWLNEYHVTHHPFRGQVGQEDYYYLTSEFGFRRVKPKLNDLIAPEAYESFTCLVSGSKYSEDSPRLERDQDGDLVYGWKANTDPLTAKQLEELIEAGMIKREESWLQLRDFDSGEPITVERGSLFWNAYRKKWILIAGRTIGEVWYAEADTPVGPWVYARRVAIHDKFFYNPTQHPFFDQEAGRLIYFEGTFTGSLFTKLPNLVPRYEYNQLMYRLDLGDERLFLPSPVYRIRTEAGQVEYRFSESISEAGNWVKVESIAFFAFPPERKLSGLIPLFEQRALAGTRLSTQQNGTRIAYVLPAKSGDVERTMDEWQCKMTNPSFFFKNFRMKLQWSDSKLEVTTDPELGITQVAVRDSSIRLNLRDQEEIYVLEGTVRAEAISGQWKTDDNAKTGTWDAKRVGSSWKSVSSTAVVPLYRYTQKDNSGESYSTSPNLDDESHVRSAVPLCRVWRNPYSQLILDYETKPLSLD